MKSIDIFKEDSTGELCAVIGSMTTAALLAGLLGYSIAVFVQGTWGMLVAFITGGFIIGLSISLGAIHLTKTLVGENKELREANKQMSKAIDRINEGEMKRFVSFVKDYYDGTEITTVSFQNHNSGILVKVGNEDHIVEVDMELMKEDTIAALEKARMEWMAAA